MPDLTAVNVERAEALPQNPGEFRFPDLKDLREKLEAADISPIEKALTPPAGARGRRPLPRRPMIRAFMAMPILDIRNISALRERLMNNSALRDACGFAGRVPSRPTFSRVFGQLAKMPELLEESWTRGLKELRKRLPNLGRDVAVDSTSVRTNANPNRDPVSDPEAGLGKKNSARARGGGEWFFGYKVHTVADANHDVPLALTVTSGNESDMNNLVAPIEKMTRSGIRPEVVIADRGYDSKKNSEWLHRRGITPVIHKKKTKSGIHVRGKRKYSLTGTPLCECGRERPFVRTDPETAERVYGPVEGCERGGKFEGFSSCEFPVKVNPESDVRLFGGAIRRDGPEWKKTYRKRWSVERVFSGWKDRGALSAHSFRGLSRIRLLALLYALADVSARIVKVTKTDAPPMAA